MCNEYVANAKRSRKYCRGTHLSDGSEEGMLYMLCGSFCVCYCAPSSLLLLPTRNGCRAIQTVHTYKHSMCVCARKKCKRICFKCAYNMYVCCKVYVWHFFCKSACIAAEQQANCKPHRSIGPTFQLHETRVQTCAFDDDYYLCCCVCVCVRVCGAVKLFVNRLHTCNRTGESSACEWLHTPGPDNDD